MARRPVQRRRQRQPRWVEVNEDSRSGLAQLNSWVEFGKSIGWIFLIAGGLVTFSWTFIGKPHAEVFVNETMRATINEFETRIADLQSSLAEGKGDVEALKAQIEALTAQLEVLKAAAEANAESNRQILESLGRLEAAGVAQ